jgi:hydrogenase/urease accessory protein HupE
MAYAKTGLRLKSLLNKTFLCLLGCGCALSAVSTPGPDAMLFASLIILGLGSKVWNKRHVRRA